MTARSLKKSHTVSFADIVVTIEKLKTASKALHNASEIAYNKLAELVELNTSEPDRSEMRSRLATLGLVLTTVDAALASQDRILDETVRNIMDCVNPS